MNDVVVSGNVEPVGALYEVVVLDTSKTASGLVLSGTSNDHLLVKILKTPYRKRQNANGIYFTNIAQAGEVVVIHKNNLVEIKVGPVSALFTSDDAIIAVVS